MAKSAAERKREERKRKRDAGYVQISLWVKPKNKAALLKYLAKLDE